MTKRISVFEDAGAPAFHVRLATFMLNKEKERAGGRPFSQIKFLRNKGKKKVIISICQTLNHMLNYYLSLNFVSRIYLMHRQNMQLVWGLMSTSLN